MQTILTEQGKPLTYFWFLGKPFLVTIAPQYLPETSKQVIGVRKKLYSYIILKIWIFL